MSRSQRERMVGGDLYLAADHELRHLHRRCKRLLYQVNHMHPDDTDERQAIVRELLGRVGKNIYIDMPFYCDYGVNIHMGNDVYANMNCVFLDVATIAIGNNVMFGPGVHLYTATHPVDPEVRSTFLEYGLPITIEDQVWIGGQTVVNPGITIGRGSLIGSGSVVTKDMPPMVIAAGNPCKVIRQLGPDDKHFWQKKKTAYIAEMGPLP